MMFGVTIWPHYSMYGQYMAQQYIRFQHSLVSEMPQHCWWIPLKFSTEIGSQRILMTLLIPLLLL